MKAPPSDLAAATIVCVLALCALARSEATPKTVAPRAQHSARPAATRVGVQQLLRGEALDLNRATEGDLVLLPGVGPKLARRILEARERHGGFTSLDELDAVPGVGPATLARLKPLVRVGPATARAPTPP